MDETGVKNLISDTKNNTLTAERLTVYVPYNDDLAYQYYKNITNTEFCPIN